MATVPASSARALRRGRRKPLGPGDSELGPRPITYGAWLGGSGNRPIGTTWRMLSLSLGILHYGLGQSWWGSTAQAIQKWMSRAQARDAAYASSCGNAKGAQGGPRALAPRGLLATAGARGARRRWRPDPIWAECACEAWGNGLCGVCAISARWSRSSTLFPDLTYEEGLAYVNICALQLGLHRAWEWGTHAFRRGRAELALREGGVPALFQVGGWRSVAGFGRVCNTRRRRVGTRARHAWARYVTARSRAAAIAGNSRIDLTDSEVARGPRALGERRWGSFAPSVAQDEPASAGTGPATTVRAGVGDQRARSRSGEGGRAGRRAE